MATFNGWNRPSLTEIKDRVFADLENNLPGKNANLRFSPLNALGSAIVGQSHEQNGYIEWGLRQATVLYCDNENLDLHGQIWGVARQLPTKASGFVVVTGIDGTLIPNNTFFSSSSGLLYASIGDVYIGEGAAWVLVKAIDYGTKFNITTNANLSITTSIPGAESTASVVSISGGTDHETDDNYRARILYKIQNPAMGGSKSDYVNWTLSQSGVTRAWCYPLENGNGTVTVRFMMDKTYENGIPTNDDALAIQAYLDTVRPVTAILTVSAPTPVPFDITVTGLTNNDNDTKNNVIAEIKNAILRDAEPGGTIHISRIWSAISLATGEQYFGSTTPSTDTTFLVSEIAVPGTVTFA